MDIRPNDVAIKNKETYIDKISNYFLIYNPLSEKGVILLNKEAAYIYSLIDGKKSIEDIYSIIQKTDKTATMTVLSKMIRSFWTSQIIYFNNPATSQ